MITFNATEKNPILVQRGSSLFALGISLITALYVLYKDHVMMVKMKESEIRTLTLQNELQIANAKVEILTKALDTNSSIVADQSQSLILGLVLFGAVVVLWIYLSRDTHFPVEKLISKIESSSEVLQNAQTTGLEKLGAKIQGSSEAITTQLSEQSLRLATQGKGDLLQFLIEQRLWMGSEFQEDRELLARIMHGVRESAELVIGRIDQLAELVIARMDQVDELVIGRIDQLNDVMTQGSGDTISSIISAITALN